MDCRDCENLLPLYHDGELERDARAAVDAHVAECAACRESLAFYAGLETALVARSSLRPPAPRTAVRVADSLGLRRRRFAFGALMGAPGLAGLGLIVCGLFLLLVTNPFRQLLLWIDQMADGYTFGLSPRIASALNEISQLSGAGEWTLITIYLGVVALVMLGGSWVVLRFVRG